MPDRKRLTHSERAARREQIAEFCKSHTLARAMSQFDVSESLVQTACREHGVTPKAPKPTNMPDRSRLRLIAALTNTTTPYAALARTHGITRQAVEQFATRCIAAGIKVKERAA